MTSQRDTLKSFTDAAADAVARVIAGVQRDAQQERELRAAEHRARLAELDARIASVAALELKVSERLASLKDGEAGHSVSVEDVTPVILAEVERLFASIPPPKDGDPGKDADPDLVAALVDEKVRAAVEALPPAEPGRSITLEDVEPLIQERIASAVASLPPPVPGKDADPEMVATLVKVAVCDAVAALPPPSKGEPGPMGKLPAIRAWEDRVYYESDAVTKDGATYQALRDTGHAPPHEDWICIAKAGKDGEDGRSFDVRGTYKPDGEYLALNVVALNGASFVAKRDNPGLCPGDGWQLIAMQGKPGKPGERQKGDKGDPGPSIVGGEIDSSGLMTLRLGDGSSVNVDMYPALSRIA